MKYLLTFFIVSTLCYTTIFSQNASKKDWSYAIDTTWGPGLSTVQKLRVFNSWWDRIDQTWGGFPNIEDEWDSLKSFYLPIIEAGVSNGRFQGILGRLTRSLKEAHSSIASMVINSSFGIYESEFPHYASFKYRPGVPVLHLSAHFNRNYFGAGVTAFNDTIALVYSVIPDHPLSLQPGDIILGYDGIPWKENLQDLLDQDLPLLYGGFLLGSNDESIEHINTSSVGLNWGLFDTIDILKYSSGETVHYPTSLLNNIPWPYPVTLPVKGQLPVDGVPFINNNDPTPVVWGIVSGTSIGYIYVYHWEGLDVQNLFKKAVDTLMHGHNVEGLIIDFRSNRGGEEHTAKDGFRQLFNIDPTPYFSDYTRVPGGGHLDFQSISTGVTSLGVFKPTSELFNHPIAVLTGPECLSMGDINAFRMRFHPMTRFFGKKTSGAFVTYDQWNNVPYSNNNYKGWIFNGSIYSNYNDEGFMIHKGNPVDEEVWLTPDGVANGQDDVVNRALEWINNMVHPYNITTDEKYYPSDGGTVKISSIVKNPNLNLLNAKGYIHNIDNVLVDSAALIKAPGGEIWSGSITVPSKEDFFKVSVTIFNETTSDIFNVPNAARFTTAGRVTVDSLTIVKSFDKYLVKVYLKNNSNSVTLNNISARLICNDPWAVIVGSDVRLLPDILPGATVSNSSGFLVLMTDPVYNYLVDYAVEVTSDGWIYWITDPLVDTKDEYDTTPKEFRLSQNYPNPFNPKTVINYQLAASGSVSLIIYDILGNEIITLFNEYRPAGVYVEEFYAEKFSSGIYFYRLKAGTFEQTKKMLILK